MIRPFLMPVGGGDAMGIPSTMPISSMAREFERGGKSRLDAEHRRQGSTQGLAEIPMQQPRDIGGELDVERLVAVAFLDENP